MGKLVKKGAVAVMVAIGATGALAESGSGGVIRFSGAVVASGYSVLAGPRVDPAPSNLQARATSLRGQTVVDFSTPAAHPVPARIWLTAREKVSGLWHRVTDERSVAGTQVSYNGFSGNQLSGSNGRLTVSRPPSAEPTVAVVTVAYR
ncbi:hypothetical protein [Ralstonia soli]|uniref:Uncharacterized protein n=1 Tax=Ralstonia soli TaxID=2953896 RepID=A0ABT1ALI3_9RALS|nr:hypothetical protein [Ralstonia soli]MCO5399290.1 hypothetical protein [Ralstonia soli]